MTSPAKLRALAMRWYSVLGVKIITSNESGAGKGPKGHIDDLHDGFTFVGNPKTTQYRRNLFFGVLPCGLSNKKYKPPLLKIMAPSSPRIKKTQNPFHFSAAKQGGLEKTGDNRLNREKQRDAAKIVFPGPCRPQCGILNPRRTLIKPCIHAFVLSFITVFTELMAAPLCSGHKSIQMMSAKGFSMPHMFAVCFLDFGYQAGLKPCTRSVRVILKPEVCHDMKKGYSKTTPASGPKD